MVHHNLKGKCEKQDSIASLFSRGPRNAQEEAILDEHIKVASKEIRDAWTDREREVRAVRAGTPIREEAQVPIVLTDFDMLGIDDG